MVIKGWIGENNLNQNTKLVMLAGDDKQPANKKQEGKKDKNTLILAGGHAARVGM